MNTFLISDTHLNHGNIETYCQRPENFTQLIRKRWNERIKPEDMVIHLGDVGIGDYREFNIRGLNGRKILVRGNHDRSHSCNWWMTLGGFDFACDSMIFRDCWLTHEPAERLVPHTKLNLHGHLHNLWSGFAPNNGELALLAAKGRLRHSWQRLFAVEYTNYYPIPFDKFVNKPDKYNARGPNGSI